MSGPRKNGRGGWILTTDLMDSNQVVTCAVLGLRAAYPWFRLGLFFPLFSANVLDNANAQKWITNHGLFVLTFTKCGDPGLSSLEWLENLALSPEADN